MNGKIRTLNMDKNYGFIQGEDGKSYFFHKSGFEGNFGWLMKDMEVEFDGENTDKGPRAENVRLL